MLSIKSREVGDVLVLDLAGPIQGGPDTTKLHETVKEALGSGRKKILLQLGGVDWLNSLGLGVLISTYVSAKRAEGKLAICNASSRIATILKTSGVAPEVFTLHESEEKAIGGF